MERNLHLKKLIDRLKFNYVERSECFRSSANYNSIYHDCLWSPNCLPISVYAVTSLTMQDLAL